MNERIKELLSRPGLERLNDWASIGPVQRAALEECIELVEREALQPNTEILTWHPADTPPETEVCVLIGFERGGWEPGYFDGAYWRSYRGDVFSTHRHAVSCWARPGPR